ncbi:hypothetical protein BpHYR1_014418 [Brachionus plicatilis]|uniref:Uncharacterized protein n=1 Tax=Brachionus plicatilis TaxID=10195 RepID=A0A3M7Q9R1_BRAPC|nr:hypothetical protein BpHYR1_014418 [Brachionus plicatilis]
MDVFNFMKFNELAHAKRKLLLIENALLFFFDPSPGFKILNTEEEIYKILIYGKSIALDNPRSGLGLFLGIFKQFWSKLNKLMVNNIKSFQKSLSSSRMTIQKIEFYFYSKHQFNFYLWHSASIKKSFIKIEVNFLFFSNSLFIGHPSIFGHLARDPCLLVMIKNV